MELLLLRCPGIRGFRGGLTDYTLSDWLADAPAKVGGKKNPPTHPASRAPSLDPANPGILTPDRPGLHAASRGRAFHPHRRQFTGGWIAWLIAQECEEVDRLILIAPAFNMMGVRAQTISPERRHEWHSAGWMPWDDDPLHREWPLSWKWVEEARRSLLQSNFDRLRARADNHFPRAWRYGDSP